MSVMLTYAGEIMRGLKDSIRKLSWSATRHWCRDINIVTTGISGPDDWYRQIQDRSIVRFTESPGFMRISAFPGIHRSDELSGRRVFVLPYWSGWNTLPEVPYSFIIIQIVSTRRRDSVKNQSIYSREKNDEIETFYPVYDGLPLPNPFTGADDLKLRREDSFYEVDVSHRRLF